MFKFKMGLQVKDKATGFAGVITARAEYDTGTILYLVEDKGGREVWITEETLELCYGE
jgi:hypothetical protein